MSLANFYQNWFFKNGHQTSLTICLNLPYQSHYPTVYHLSSHNEPLSYLNYALSILIHASLSLPGALLHYSPWQKSTNKRSLKDTSVPFPHTLPEYGSWYLTSPLSPNFFPASPEVSSFSPFHGVSSPPGHTKLAPTLPPTHRMTDIQTSPFHVFCMWLHLASAGTSGSFHRLSLEGRVESALGEGHN